MKKETKTNNEKGITCELFKEYKTSGDKEIRNRIYQDNENLVYFFLSKFKTMPDYEDILQEGKIGLLKAIEKYDLNSGIQFSTFAAHYIKGYAKHCSQSYSSLYLPANMKWKYKRYLGCKDSEKNMTCQELMDCTGLSKDEILQFENFKNLNHLIYLDNTYSQDNDDDLNLSEVIEDSHVNIEKTVILEDVDKQVITALYETFSDFSNLQYDILFYHFGLKNYPKLKDIEIARKLNISVQIVKKTMTLFGRRQKVLKQNIRNRFSIPALVNDVDIADMLYK